MPIWRVGPTASANASLRVSLTPVMVDVPSFQPAMMTSRSPVAWGAGSVTVTLAAGDCGDAPACWTIVALVSAPATRNS